MIGLPIAAVAQTPAAPGPATLAPPAAQTGQAPAGQIQAGQTSWVSQCASDSRGGVLQCSVKAEVGVAATGQLLASFTVNIPSDTHMPAMLVQVPLGLSLAEGVSLNVDGANSQTLPLQTCDTNGCYAGGPVAAKLLTALMGGKTLTIAFVGINKQAVTLPFNLTGFAAASLKSSNDRLTSHPSCAWGLADHSSRD